MLQRRPSGYSFNQNAPSMLSQLGEQTGDLNAAVLSLLKLINESPKYLREYNTNELTYLFQSQFLLANVSYQIQIHSRDTIDLAILDPTLLFHTRMHYATESWHHANS